jgi:hypothetical protein
MKRTLKISLVAAIIASIAIVSCKKYEEGPGLSLRTKKGRLTGDWKLKAVYENGVDISTQYIGTSSISSKIEKDGSITSISGGYTLTGTWEFLEKKEQLKTTYVVSGVTYMDTIEIIKLKNKEFWTRELVGDPNKQEFHWEK